MEQTSSQSTNE